MSKSTPTEAPLPNLSDFLCFAVYSANLAFGRAYKPILEALGITYTQWIAIVALWENDHLSVKQLGEKLFLESNTLTPILKKLEELGYLRRQRDPADERQVIVSLTDEGKRLRKKGAQRDLIAATGLDPEEFDRTQQAIAKMRDSLLKHVDQD
ncbi:MarR family winged helix-turn-helix transcriptional regulator [Pandoraea anhela]|uniref:MarR family transcriptional regulator n=1 Tax=Pandoraea anhela TaxID=2508295 RepID=A0A5E4SK14_9BURK|nr:MarR family transcriptional regulator [Pandoraea anhela]VVD75353.1 MarR family transcriptional regulator [Pandoraea anhela]